VSRNSGNSTLCRARRLFATATHGFPIRTGRVPTIFGRGLSSTKDAVAVEDTEHLQRPAVDRRA